MPSLASVNPKRAWLLFAAVWLPLVAAYSWPRVEQGWYESNRVREEINRSIRETKFQDCARANGVDWFQHLQRYKYECESEAQRNCDGSLLCATDLLTSGCLKRKVSGCEGLAWLVAGDGSDLGLSDKDFREKEDRDRLAFYLDRTFSYPLYAAVAWAVGPLLLLAVLPRVVRILWKWLTTKQP